MSRIKRFNESNSDDSYRIAKIIDILKGDLSIHNKVLNLSKIAGVGNIELPPYIIPCKITLKSGEKHTAYLEENRLPFSSPDEGDDLRGIWVEYGKIGFIRSMKKDPSRKRWKINEVESWEFI